MRCDRCGKQPRQCHPSGASERALRRAFEQRPRSFETRELVHTSIEQAVLALVTGPVHEVLWCDGSSNPFATFPA